MGQIQSLSPLHGDFKKLKTKKRSEKLEQKNLEQAGTEEEGRLRAVWGKKGSWGSSGADDGQGKEPCV